MRENMISKADKRADMFMCTMVDVQLTWKGTPLCNCAIHLCIPVVVVGTQISVYTRLCCYFCVRKQTRRVDGLGCENLRDNNVAICQRLFQCTKDAHANAS